MLKADMPYQLIGIACLAIVFPNIATGQSSSSRPTEVWVRGSDIGTSEHSLTLRLRDALEAVIHTGPNAVAAANQTIVWLPEDVRIEGSKFTYKAFLADKQLHTSRVSTGQCSERKLDNCARAILRDLGH